MSHAEARQSLAQAAMAYARAGWPVHPLGRRGKAPMTPHGVKDATNDPRRVEAWWQRWPEANIGLAIPAGFLVVDIDAPEALGHLQAEDLTLPTTASATTGRGEHLWYSTGGATVTNRVAVFPNIDIRAKGGFVVAPPSIHPSGALYEWRTSLDRATIAECPGWLLARLTATSRRAAQSVDDWIRTITEPVPEGQRNETLARVSGLLLRRLPPQLAAEMAVCWAKVRLVPPLPDREVRRTIESIAGRELRRRGGAA